MKLSMRRHCRMPCVARGCTRFHAGAHGRLTAVADAVDTEVEPVRGADVE